MRAEDAWLLQNLNEAAWILSTVIHDCEPVAGKWSGEAQRAFEAQLERYRGDLRTAQFVIEEWGRDVWRRPQG